jgi:aspartokinase
MMEISVVVRSYSNSWKRTIYNMQENFLESEDIALEEQLKSFFTEMDWVLNEKPNKSFDYYYDQIVCMGELLSTAIMAAYLRKQGMKVQWLDIRDSIKTGRHLPGCQYRLAMDQHFGQRSFSTRVWIHNFNPGIYWLYR